MEIKIIKEVSHSFLEGKINVALKEGWKLKDVVPLQESYEVSGKMQEGVVFVAILYRGCWKISL